MVHLAQQFEWDRDANHLKTGWLLTTAGAQAVDMFARKVSMHLKGSVPEFTQTLEREVLPLLRKQKGFRDEITFVAPGGREAFGISL
jgi:hypothetical protein